MSEEKKHAGVIDCTPTWVGVLPILIESINNGQPGEEGYEAAATELGRMASLADLYVQHIITKTKANAEKKPRKKK